MTRKWLGLVALWACVGCSVPISSGLEETDANRVVVALEKSGIGSDKETDPAVEGRFRVVVARDDASAAATVLSQEGLPPPAAPGVLDSLGDSSLVPSRTAEHAKLVQGTAGELERSLRAVDGILSARVHLAVPSKGPLGDEQTTLPTASVLVRHRGATPPLAPAEVQRLVAGAIPGMEAKNVNVVLAPVPDPGRPPERELARFGPVTVTRSSLLSLRIVVAAVALINVLLLALIVGFWLRMRRAQGELDALRLATEGGGRDGT
ncbi:MAG: hypothetical protein R3B13_22595 [Polyangiaceae bacterium]